MQYVLQTTCSIAQHSGSDFQPQQVTDSLEQPQLRRIAADVGTDWKMLGRQLGLEEPVLTTIERQSHGDLVEASLQALLRCVVFGQNGVSGYVEQYYRVGILQCMTLLPTALSESPLPYLLDNIVCVMRPRPIYSSALRNRSTCNYNNVVSMATGGRKREDQLLLHEY